MTWLGQKGFGALMTCRRDRLPEGIETKYWHKDRTESNDKSRVARFFQPVVATKDFDATNTTKAYQRVHISFQSTSSCNFTTVNSLNMCKLGLEKREQGRGHGKRVWGIEMNHARKLYLNTYYRIDVIDHLIKNCRMYY